jgi:hypothetical protein
MRRFRLFAVVTSILVPLGACAPSYQPRSVPVPAECEQILRNAAEIGPERVAADAAEFRRVAFCQQQQSLKAAEEQAAHARMQARAQQTAYWLSLGSAAVWLLLVVADGGF